MKNVSYYGILFFAAAAYFTASKHIFDRVYKTTEIVIDELFHIPQGLEFCYGNFSYWNPKITTPPGLYLISTAMVTYFFECSTYSLRFVNLIASSVNLFLFYSLLKYVYSAESQSKIVLQALNLAILPPLYFFSHVYYTDTLSMTFLLSLFRLRLSNNHKILILFFGIASIIMRQTNAVWVAMILGHKVLDILIRTSRVYGNSYLTKSVLRRKSIIAKEIDGTKLKRYYDFYDLYLALKYHISTFFTTAFKLITVSDFLTILTHVLTLLSFISFVYLNGSIVLGDKTAHEATIHIPQMFYFLLFYAVFGLPYVLYSLPSTIRLIFRNKILFFFYTALFLLIVHYNTIVHPYLLADNRHYTFYMWNRWYGKYDFAVYASVPIYVFLLFSLYDNLKDQNCISFLLPYTVAAFLALALQKMIEVRYFLIPYIILRLRFRRPSMAMVIFEFVWYLILNAVVFYLFFTKEIYWRDFDYAQRIIW